MVQENLFYYVSADLVEDFSSFQKKTWKMHRYSRLMQRLLILERLRLQHKKTLNLNLKMKENEICLSGLLNLLAAVQLYNREIRAVGIKPGE